MLQAHISSVSVCFTCMFQLFYADVAKVDQDIAMVVYVCCKRFSSVFQLFLYMYFCKCFRCLCEVFQLFFTMLQVLHPGISKLDQDVFTYCHDVSIVRCKCFI